MSNMVRLFLLLGLLAIPFAFASAAAQPSANGRQVVESVCNKCHTYGRICLNLGRDEQWWSKTTRRMISNGAPIKEPQAEAAASFLATLEQGSAPVCR